MEYKKNPSMNQEKNQRNFWDFLAFGISAFLSPYVTAGIFILIITFTYAKNLKEFLPWISIGFLFAIIIPGTYILWLIEKRDIRDFHLSDHNQRKIPFMIAGISAVIGAIALYLIQAAKPVIVMGAAYAANSVGISILTVFWKVSVHTALYSSVVTVIVILFGISFAPLYLILIPLSWARVYRQRHTLSQVIGGAMIAFVVTALVFWLFKYI
ncbi:MAG: hypothetical protein HW405_300 [Candidatus Berkelbacteria bacterium]|nr:hypothetical protein [Candidatus Berkelbacteria bacterium]